MSVKEREVRRQILGCINRAVNFTYPGKEGARRGQLTDRVVLKSIKPKRRTVPYWNVVDVIQFDGERERWMRFGYYRKPKGRLNWASQTTLTDRISVWRRLFVHAAREKPWFRDLLEDVMRDLKVD